MPIPLGGKKKPAKQQPVVAKTMTQEQVSKLRPQTSLPPGAVVAQGSLTDTEKRVLAQMGWKPGQPVPSGLASELADVEVVQDVRELQKRLQQQAKEALPLPPNTPPLQVPKATLLQDLPASEQQRILGNMKQTFDNTRALVHAAQEEAKNPKPQFKDPSLGMAVEQILQQSGAADILVAPPREEPPQVVKATDLQHPAAYLTDREREKLSTQVPVPQAPAPEVPSYGTGVVNDKPICKHCGFDQTLPEPAENPSYEDKMNFLQSVLGQIRFKKIYSLLEGKIIVVFRTLTTEEADLCMTQTALDMAKTFQVHNDKAFWRTLSDYRLALALSAVYIEGRGKLYEAPEDIWTGFDIAEEDKPKDSTILPLIVQHIYSEVLTLDSIRRMVGVNFISFQRMVELMEARVLDPNFWTATEEPR